MVDPEELASVGRLLLEGEGQEAVTMRRTSQMDPVGGGSGRQVRRDGDEDGDGDDELSTPQNVRARASSDSEGVLGGPSPVLGVFPDTLRDSATVGRGTRKEEEEEEEEGGKDSSTGELGTMAGDDTMPRWQPFDMQHARKAPPSGALLAASATRSRGPTGAMLRRRASDFQMATPGMSVAFSCDQLAMQRFGSTREDMSRTAALRRLGASVESVENAREVAGPLVPEGKLHDKQGSHRDATKVERIMGYTEGQLKRSKALALLGETEETLGDKTSRTLAMIGEDPAVAMANTKAALLANAAQPIAQRDGDTRSSRDYQTWVPQVHALDPTGRQANQDNARSIVDSNFLRVEDRHRSNQASRTLATSNSTGNIDNGSEPRDRNGAGVGRPANISPMGSFRGIMGRSSPTAQVTAGGPSSTAHMQQSLPSYAELWVAYHAGEDRNRHLEALTAHWRAEHAHTMRQLQAAGVQPEPPLADVPIPTKPNIPAVPPPAAVALAAMPCNRGGISLNAPTSPHTTGSGIAGRISIGSPMTGDSVLRRIRRSISVTDRRNSSTVSTRGSSTQPDTPVSAAGLTSILGRVTNFSSQQRSQSQAHSLSQSRPYNATRTTSSAAPAASRATGGRHELDGMELGIAGLHGQLSPV